MSNATTELGQIIEGLGCEWEAKGRLIAGAVVLLKTVDDEGDVGMSLVCSDGMDWMTRLGMLAAAVHEEKKGFSTDEDEG
jgi:hypothetical protein